MSAARPTLLPPRGVSLLGNHILLRPLGRRDAMEIAQVPDDPAWALLLRRPNGGGATPELWLDNALREARRGREQTWTIRDRDTNQLLGSTRYLNIDLHHRRLEIGATWLLEEARGTVANVESKLLLLDHAFTQLGVDRVHIQADVDNHRSRRAIEALGATPEGILRRHIVRPDGSTRDTAVYSIIADEWPELRSRLGERVAHRTPDWRFLPSSLEPREPQFPFAAIS